MKRLTIITLAAVMLSYGLAQAQVITQTANFNLSWTDNSNLPTNQEDGTEIEVGPKAGPFVFVTKVGRDVTTYKHIVTDDPGGVEQCFRVRAFNKIGTTPYSNIACGTSPVIQLAPNTPGNVTVNVTVSVTVNP